MLSRYELRYFNRGRADKRAGLPPLPFDPKTKKGYAYLAGYGIEQGPKHA